jgi:general stress protein 26
LLASPRADLKGEHMADKENKEHPTHEEAVQKLAAMIKGIDIGMLTTIAEDGTLHSRPMRAQDVEFNGDLWFMTKADSDKVHEIEVNPQVSVSFARPDKQNYVSVSGTGELVRDRTKIDEFWSPIYISFFPEGKDDPNLALIKVSVEQAEYWGSPSSPVVFMAGFLKVKLTGKQVQVGENEKIDL